MAKKNDKSKIVMDRCGLKPAIERYRVTPAIRKRWADIEAKEKKKNQSKK